MLDLLGKKLDKTSVRAIFDASFYKMVYKKKLGKKEPFTHFLANYKSLEFDPNPEISLSELCSFHGISAKELVDKLALDDGFYEQSRSISPSVLSHFSIVLSDKQLKDLKTAANLVDSNFYNRCNYDMAQTWLTPYLHYCLFGIEEGRNPAEFFNTRFYVEEYSDVLKENLNPIVHYHEFGKSESRYANIIEKQTAENAAAKQREIEQATVFDVEYYLRENKDVAEAGIDPYVHYIENGESEGRKPNEYFSPNYYLACNEDVAEAQLSPLSHFSEFGYKEEREYLEPEQESSEIIEPTQIDISKSSRADVFDSEYYLETNPDVADANVDPYWHYVESGEREGRMPNAFFSPDFYKKLNADVRVARISPFDHFRQHGFYEGRLGVQPTMANRSSQRKPLLFVGHDGIQAGSEVVLLEIIKWFFEHTNREIKVLLLSPGPMSNFYAEYADTYVLPEYRVDSKDELAEFLSNDFEFCYINTVVAGILFDFLEQNNISLNGDVVAHIHEMEKVINENIEGFNKLAHSAKHFISASPATTETLINTFALSSDSVTTVPAFIRVLDPDLSGLDALKLTAREELQLRPESFVIAGCGTVYWRKGPDLFLETARKVLENNTADIQFVWIGPGPDLEELSSSLTDEEQKNISFVGSKNNANELLAAADLFFMSSREDPFPLVVMEAAQHKVPSICFSETTGITDFIQDDAGVCLPDMNLDRAAELITSLSEDKVRVSELGSNARDRLMSAYTTEKQCLNIYSVLERNTSYRPAVSVVVPFYNHEKFAKERLDTILAQEIKDIEIIVLDDLSTDDTVAEANKYLGDARLKIFVNEENSGSPFKQWKKGIELAKADLLWIAEGDDACDLNFLSTLIPYFDDPFVTIASGKTEIMDESSTVKDRVLDSYLDSAYVGKYQQTFIKNGFDEVNESFGAVCTLVNASGLLLRVDSIDDAVLDYAAGFKMCGDWLVYLSCLKEGKLAYDVTTKNYFRRHSASVVNKIEGSDIYFSERYRISEYVFNNFDVTKKLVHKTYEAINGEWERFKFKHPGKEFSELYNKQVLQELIKIKSEQKHVGFYVHGMLFSKGGIERLMADIANYLAPKGYSVTIYCRRWGEAKESIYPLFENIRVVPIFDETDQENSIVELRKALQQDKIDVFVPMLSEWLFSPIVEAAKHTGIPVIASEHNDPWKIIELWWDKDERIKCFESVDKIHLLLNKFTESLPEHLQDKVTLIPNGIDLPSSVSDYSTRERLIVGVGRLAEQKRFDRLINAVSIIQDELRQQEWRVEIYGEGHLRAELTDQINSEGVSDILQLKGLTDNIGAVLNRAAINVMPSEFEGFGIALVEAMAYGVPSIAFEECNGPNEIIESEVSGYLVSSEEGLANTIVQLIKNSSHLQTLSINAQAKALEYSKTTVFPLWEDIISKDYE